MQTRVLLVHGGMTFKNRKDYLHYLKNKEIDLKRSPSWSGEYLTKKLGKDFEVIRPSMPLKEDAKYEDWKIFFELHLKFLKGKFILVGVSLGGIFLAKYLSENKLQKKALSVYLICPPFDNTTVGEDLVGGFKLKGDLSLIKKNTKNLHLMFSKDDDVVPVSHAKKYEKKLDMEATIYEDKNGHFRVSEFPEIVKMIKKEIK
jgi:predicted alpha/beta hydrolase family esterase